MLSKEPILLLITIYMSFMYGVMYGRKYLLLWFFYYYSQLFLVFEALPVIFIEKRNLTHSQCGLIFLGVGIGTSFAALIHLLLSRRYPHLVEEWKGYPPPEERLYGAMIAGPCMFVGSLWLGWTGNYATIPWYVPALSLIPIGMSVALILVSFQAYLIDTYLWVSCAIYVIWTYNQYALQIVYSIGSRCEQCKLNRFWCAFFWNW